MQSKIQKQEKERKHTSNNTYDVAHENESMESYHDGFVACYANDASLTGRQ